MSVSIHKEIVETVDDGNNFAIEIFQCEGFREAVITLFLRQLGKINESAFSRDKYSNETPIEEIVKKSRALIYNVFK